VDRSGAGVDPAAGHGRAGRYRGAVAGRQAVTIGKVRGAPLTLADGSECWVTVHPSSLLRIPDAEGRRAARKLFVRDLKRIKARAAELAG